MKLRVETMKAIFARIACFLLALACASAAPAEDDVGFSGAQFRHFSDVNRGMYVMGVIAGLAASDAFGGTEVTKAFLACVKGMTGEQEVAIVDKWIESHPQHWHAEAGAIVVLSFLDACPDFARVFDRRLDSLKQHQ
jgi:hypothetical protein